METVTTGLPKKDFNEDPKFFMSKEFRYLSFFFYQLQL